MALTDTKIRNLKAQDKPYKVADEKGLFLLITANGSKCWRVKYRIAGKEKLLALGLYPDVSLADAREKRDNARKLIAAGTDPSIEKQMAKRTAQVASENTFETLAMEWHGKQINKWSAGNSSKIKRRFELHIFPWLGHRPINEITPAEILSAIRRIESKGSFDTAHGTLQNCRRVFRYAIVTQRAQYNPCSDLQDALEPAKSKPRPTITDPKAIGELLRAIHGYEGHFATRYALKLAPLFFVRIGELRYAEWSEFDFDAAEWRIPAEKMKMSSVHIVPLAEQAIRILKDLYEINGQERYLFPSLTTAVRPICENTINGALRRLGYDTSDEMTGHGFRSMASTLLNEQGWNRDAIERQLAHTERNAVRAAYNYAEYLPERRKMMQHWADYLGSLANDGKILQLKTA